MNLSTLLLRKVSLLYILIFLVSACEVNGPVRTETVEPIQSPIPTNTITLVPPTPTPTPIPMAALINGEGITIEEYEAELSRYRAALVDGISQNDQEAGMLVLGNLFNQVLLAQGAVENGFIIDEEALRTQLTALISAAGGQDKFDQWLQENGYTLESFNTALERSTLGAWMRDQILAEVPLSADQVHVQQILLYNSDQANQILAELESGREFATLAAIYEPVTQGNLGWFPRDFLPHPLIEEAAFNLQPGEYSQVIETSVGFHIILVAERDPDHPLSPEARLIWRENALQEWMAMRREQSDIVILIPQQGE
jgi:parvulin-like peptidyl-prolyl isomerase